MGIEKEQGHGKCALLLIQKWKELLGYTKGKIDGSRKGQQMKGRGERQGREGGREGGIDGGRERDEDLKSDSERGGEEREQNDL